jgi:filamentous hemagglutinin family protein
MTRIASSARRTLLAQMIAAALASAPLFAAAHSLPTGATVVAGNVTFSQSTPNELDIHQSSNTAITNWQSFSVGAGYTVQFMQPSASSVSLNRVVGSNPTAIYGNLVANGQVFLINGKGVLFGRSAQVDTGGLVASTLNLSDQNFLAGNYVFSDPGNTSSVVNQGRLKANNGGVLALIGHQAINLGSMQASLGSVVLGAGGTAQLALAGNKLIKFEIRQSALGALARNGGLIQADGGQVILSAGARDSLLASTVNSDGIIEARTVQGQSGHILLLSGMQAGTTQVGGTLDASAPGGGRGGAIETSGANVKVADSAHVTTKAEHGQTGSWLIDPTDFTIAASGGDMTGAALSTALAAGNVTIQSTSGASGTAGDINVNDSASWSANTLTLDAQHDININAALNGSGTAGLALWYGQGAAAAGNTASYNVKAKVNLASTGSFQTQLGSDGSPINWTIITSLGAQFDTSGVTLQGIRGNLAGHYVLGADIDASSTNGWVSGFAPIGNTSNYFTGSFDGLGHVINGLVINLPGNNGTGLFYDLNGATVRNVGLVGGVITGNSNTGALAGVASGSVIDNVYAAVNVNGNGAGTGHVGGLVGYMSGGSISNSHTTGGVGVYNAYQIGGLVGYLDGGSISNSYAGGNVSTSVTSDNSNSSAGGLVGYVANGGSISNSYATGSVQGQSSLGGLVGWLYNGSISNAYATGNVSLNTSNRHAFGGLVGRFSSGSISNAYAAGNVYGSSTSDTGGGLVGYMVGGSISDTYAMGSVNPGNTSAQFGGLVGERDSGGISNSFYATTDGVGGAINNSGNVDAFSLWAGNSIGTGKTYAQLQTLSTFASWGSDIDDRGGTGSVWRIYDGYSTPLLRSFLTPLAATLQGGLGKTYDGSAASGAVSYTLSDATATVGGDSGSVSYSTGSKNAGTYSVANGKLSVTGGLYSDQTGYDISYAGSYVIAQKQLSGTVTTSDKVYDGTTAAAVNGTLDTTGVISGDVVSLNTDGGSFADKNVGTGKVVNVGSALQGADAGNYLLLNTAGTLTASITPRQIAITGLVANDKTYDGSTAVSLSNWGSVDTGIAGETLTLTLTHGAASFADANAANGIAVTATGYGLADGSDLASNYQLTSSSATTTANITPVTLTYTADATGRTYGAANPAFSGTLTGFVNGESLATATTGTLSWTTPATTTSNVGSYAVDGSGLVANNGNYIFVQAAGNNSALTVTPAALTVTASDMSKVYGQTPTLTGFTSSGLQNGETIGSVTESSAGTSATANVGSYAIGASNATGGTFDAGNYTITYANGNLAVTPAALTVTAGNASKIYGQTPTLLGFTSSGLLNGETIGSVTETSAGTSATANVGSYAIGVNNAMGGTFDAGNYTITYANGSLAVTPATLTYAADAASRTYGAANPAFSGTLTGFVNGESLATATIGTLSWTTPATTTSNVGSYAVDGSGLVANNGNYVFAQAAGNSSALTVTPAALTVTADNASKTYGQTPILTGFTSSGLQNGETIGSVTESSAGTSATANVGSYAVGASNATGGTFNAGNYTITYANGNLMVTPAPLTVTASDASKVYGQTPTLTGFTGSGLQNGETIGSVTETSTGTSAAANVGSYAIGASNATGGTFNAGNYTITYADGSLVISPAALTVTADNASKVYGQTPTLTGFTSSGLQNGETIGSVTESSAGTSATSSVAGGPYAISAGNATGGTFNAGNYTITYANGSLVVTPATLTYTADAANRTYGVANPTLGGTLTGFVNGETPTSATTGTLTWATSATNTSNVGSYAIDGSGFTANNGNYVFAQAAGNSSALTVTPAALTVTADNASKVYGQTPTLMGFTSSGLQNGETIGSVTESSAGASAPANVGSYAIGASNATGGTFEAGNYTITYVNGSLVVTPAMLTYTADTASRTYGAANPILGGTLTGFVNGEARATATTGTLNWLTSATNTSNVGSYAVDGSGLVANNGNYTFTQAAGNSSALTVTPAALTVTADNMSKVYGQTPTLTGFTSSGLQNGETIGSMAQTSTGTSATADVGSYVIGAGNATGGTFDASNYTITYVNGSLVVTPATLTYTANVAGRTYGAANPILGGTLTGFVNGETQATAVTGTLTWLTSATNTSNVGSYAVDGSGLVANNGNYVFIQAAGNTTALTVTPATLTYTANVADRTYGAANPAFSGTLTGFVNGDTLASATAGTLAWTTPATNTSDVGSYAIDGSGLAANNGNYIFTQTAGNTTALTVTPAPLTVTAENASKIYGQTPTLLGFTSSGLQNGETIGSVSETSTGTSARASVADGPYAISASNASGGTFDAGNYAITYIDGSLVVTPAPLRVVANDATRTADGTPYKGGNGVTVTGFVNGENAGVLGGTLTYGGSSQGALKPGSYAIAPGGLVAANYIVSFADGTLVIARAPDLAGLPGAQGAVAAAQSEAGDDDWAESRRSGRSGRAEGAGLIRSIGAGVKLPAGVN